MLSLDEELELEPLAEDVSTAPSPATRKTVVEVLPPRFSTTMRRGEAYSSKSLLIGLLALGLFAFLVGYLIGSERGGGGDTPPPQPSPTPPTLSQDIKNQVSTTPTVATTTTTTTTPTTSQKWTTEDRPRLEKAITDAEERVKFLQDYYGEYADRVLYGDAGLSFGFSKPNHEPTNQASFSRTADQIARVILYREPLRLGFIGSSVMCGHDNCYRWSFPIQLLKFIQATFSAVGSPVDIRNACQGGGCGDSYENQVFCFRHMVGDDIDFLWYEWTYFEQSQQEQWHELVARWALLLPKAPPLSVVNMDTFPWATNIDMNARLLTAYAPFGANGISLSNGLSASGKWGGKKWGESGDGMHATCRDDTKKSVVFVNWHPGPLGMQYMADLASLLYLRALAEASKRLLSHPTREAAEAKYPRMPHPVVHIPKPVTITNPDLTPLAMMEEPPGCWQMEQTTFGKPQVLVADDVSDSLNPYANKVKKLGSGPTAWSSWVAPINLDMVQPREEKELPECAPPDRCSYFLEPTSPEGKSTPLVFRLPKMTQGLIVLCGYGKKASRGMLDSNFVVEFDGKPMDKSKFWAFPQTKCIALQKKWNGPVQDASGHLYLAIFPASQGSLQLSQVIVA